MLADINGREGRDSIKDFALGKQVQPRLPASRLPTGRPPVLSEPRPLPCLPGPAWAPCSAWWSSSSWRSAWGGSRSLRRPRSFSNTACRMPARMPCWWAFQLEAIPFGSPGPVLYSEDWWVMIPQAILGPWDYPGASQRTWATEFYISAVFEGIKINPNKMHNFTWRVTLICWLVKYI